MNEKNCKKYLLNSQFCQIHQVFSSTTTAIGKTCSYTVLESYKPKMNWSKGRQQESFSDKFSTFFIKGNWTIFHYWHWFWNCMGSRWKFLNWKISRKNLIADGFQVLIKTLHTFLDGLLHKVSKASIVGTRIDHPRDNLLSASSVREISLQYLAKNALAPSWNLVSYLCIEVGTL